MAPETSQFESCEMLGAFLASTPLVEETWRLCRRADADAQRSFVAQESGRVSYVAFSGVQAVARSRDMVELDEKVFGWFRRGVEGKGAVMVDAPLLQLFLSFYASLHFQQQISEVLKQSKSVVFGGHSVGGAIASLSALWLLSYIRTASPQHPISVLCITFGSPMLGNQSFSQAIIQERWDGNFCHVVAPHDLLPRLLSAPLASDMITTDEEKARLFNNALRKDEDEERCSYWPFGNYMFCSDKGAVCLDNATAILKFLYLTMAAASSPTCSVNYEDYVAKLSCHYLKMRSSTAHYDSSNEAGVAFALQTLGISSHQEAAATRCLDGARRVGWPRSLNNAKMAVSLGKINPCRAEIEWYKKYCDDCGDELGYYDAFKRRGASRREFKVNMNRLRLGRFWEQLIEKMETNQLTRDFHKLAKYVNASNFYKLLVEPLEIAEYYRTGKHREKGHYIQHGRERRFKMFDKWWGERVCGDEEATPRSKYANLTQDSCFWARVEEAICFIYDVVAEADAGRRLMLLHKIDEFEKYASGMVERMEVSVDVLAKNSSYNLFRQEWGELRAQLQLQLPPPSHFPRFQDGMVQ
ncbi:lipase-like PAD4 isoform X2 [Salvia miltiorrhiza]|uniref:lipase-like PAD4 isoform X2 n=1 Tax=Salvia miltiorrhiza TaxID=226208 RepID=UPI0025ABDFFE|nr:lipase-like PAD4 isoform X2 [Salvia miltiorrhiza]